MAYNAQQQTAHRARLLPKTEQPKTERKHILNNMSLICINDFSNCHKFSAQTKKKIEGKNVENNDDEEEIEKTERQRASETNKIICNLLSIHICVNYAGIAGGTFYGFCPKKKNTILFFLFSCLERFECNRLSAPRCNTQINCLSAFFAVDWRRIASWLRNHPK